MARRLSASLKRVSFSQALESAHIARSPNPAIIFFHPDKTEPNISVSLFVADGDAGRQVRRRGPSGWTMEAEPAGGDGAAEGETLERCGR